MRRSQFDEGSQVHRNLAVNPGMVSATSGVIQRTNLITNPGFEAAGALPYTVRTNLLTNPNLETIGSTNVTARTNLATNPSMEAGSGAATLRTNLVVSSRGVSALTGYGSQTITPNVAVSNHPEGFTTALRVEYGSTGANPGVLLVDSVESGVTYHISAWVYHETYGGGSVAFAQQSVTSQPNPPAVVVGEWRKVSWTRASTATNGIGYRISTQASAGSFLITGMQVEKTSVALPFFDALTTTTNRAKNPSMESSEGAVTVRTNFCVNPRPSTTSDYSLGATGTATTFTGGKPAVQATANGSQTPYVFSARSSSAVAVGETYALSALVEFSSGVGRVHIRAHRRSTNEYFTSGQNINYDPTGKGVHRVSVLFTSPSAISASDLDLSLVFYNSAGTIPAAGEWGRMGEVLIEKAGSIMPFFDGATSATSDFTYSWAGTANSSASYQRGTNATLAWAARWFGNGGGAGYTYRSIGTGIDGGNALRKVWTTENTTASMDVGIGTVLPVVGGATYTSSIYQKSSIDQVLTCFVEWKDSTGTTISTSSRMEYVPTPAGTWVRGSTTVTAPDNAVTGNFIFGPYTNSVPMPAGSYVEWDRAMVEESAVLRAYQDGTVSAPGDFTYSWSGTAHNSQSLMRAVGVTGYTSGVASIVSQSAEWAGSGSKSIRVSGLNTSADSYANVPFTLVTGKTYTISATCRLEAAQTGALDASNRARKIVVYHSNVSGGATVATSSQAPSGAGTTNLSVTFTVTDGTQYQSIRLYNGAAQGGGDVWWDNLLIEEADHVMPYFDGSTTPAQDTTHVWSGTAHASSSLMRVDMPAGVTNSGYRVGHLSTEWAARGTKSIKIPHLYAAGASVTDNFVEFHNMINGGPTLKANTTYTISGTCRTSQVLGGTLNGSALKFRVNMGGVELPVSHSSIKSNTSGATRVVATFTSATATNVVFLRAMAGASYGNGDVWWDELCLEEGSTEGTYFDGGYSSKENIVKEPLWNLFQSTVTPNVSYDGSTWTRATATAQTAGALSQVRQSVALSDLSQGAPYTVAATIRNESASASSTISIDWCDGPSQSWTLAPGETRRIVGNFAARASGYTTVYRFFDLGFTQVAGSNSSILIKDILIERGTTSGDYFAGSVFTSTWQGTTDNSASFQRAPSVLNWALASNGAPYQSIVSPYLGTKCAGVQTRGTNGDGLYHADINITAGFTYTMSAWVKLSSTVPTFSGVLRFKDNSGNMTDLGETVHTSLVVGSWTRVSVSGTAPVGSTKLQPMWRIYASHTPTTFYVDGVMVEQWPTLQDYFDGSSVDTPDVEYDWTGAGQMTTSVQKARVVTWAAANKSNQYLDSRFPTYQITTEDGAPASRWVAPKGTGNPVWRVAGFTAGGFDWSKIKAGGQYTIWVRYRSSGWPVNNTVMIQISNPGAQNHIIGGTTAPLNQTGWQEYRRTFKALRDGDNTHMIYMSLPLAPNLSADATFDVRDWGIYEGEYNGDLIHGGLSFSKWEGTPHASTSIGYPPQLLDIAGKPLLDLNTAGDTVLSEIFTDSEPRTFYTIMEAYSIPHPLMPAVVTYGINDLSDTIANTTMMLRYQGQTIPAVVNRRTGGGGPVSAVPLSKMVICWGMHDGAGQFTQVNNGTYLSQPSAMSVPHQRIRVSADTTVHKHFRTIMYRGLHNEEMRTAMSRYLGNKYGANVA